MSEPASDDPVRRTERQLRCYYHCVARGEELCPECIEREERLEEASVKFDPWDDEELWNPPL